MRQTPVKARQSRGKAESQQSRVTAKQSRSKAESQQSRVAAKQSRSKAAVASVASVRAHLVRISRHWRMEARGALREAAVTADYHHPRSRQQSVQVSSARRVVSGRRQRRRRQRKRGGRKWACPRAKEPRGHQEGHCIPI
ncbi:hypothetical protein D9C73_000844 [Collichthys lucidus]|uniref:Uncharacterized protein n=1 Tax=Collichthys lucidus TaxID=240159 RepID=A0A4V6AMA3_COLLU|nr:hypothetical protein D9C73_000844 [Collichthys lucidus]